MEQITSPSTKDWAWLHSSPPSSGPEKSRTLVPSSLRPESPGLQPLPSHPSVQAPSLLPQTHSPGP